MTNIDEAASLRKEDERDAQERGASREEFGAVPDVPLAGDWDEDDGKKEPAPAFPFPVGHTYSDPEGTDPDLDPDVEVVVELDWNLNA